MSGQIGIGRIRGARARIAYVLAVVVAEFGSRYAMRFLGAAARCARWVGRVLRAIGFHAGMDAGTSTGILGVIGVITFLGLPLLLGALISYLLKLGLVIVGVLAVIVMSV